MSAHIGISHQLTYSVFSTGRPQPERKRPVAHELRCGPVTLCLAGCILHAACFGNRVLVSLLLLLFCFDRFGLQASTPLLLFAMDVRSRAARPLARRLGAQAVMSTY